MGAYSLVMVGAHNGSKTVELVTECATRGRVLLVEPVSHLFEELVGRHRGNDAVSFLNAVVAEDDADQISFYAPRPGANDVVFYGDQLGSLSGDHAIIHHAGLQNLVDEISVPAWSFTRLLDTYDITDIDVLHTDTEGYDARILATFPFQRLRPRQIVFEFKHSDGVFHLGRKLAALLVLLEDQGYRTSVLDVENLVANRLD